MNKAKFEEWEYMLKSAIYLSLIGYKNSNGYTIPCKTRGEMEDAILARFTQSMKEGKYDPPQPQQKAQFSRGDIILFLQWIISNNWYLTDYGSELIGLTWFNKKEQFPLTTDQLLTEYLNSKTKP